MTGEVQEGAWWLKAQCINRHSTPMFYIWEEREEHIQKKKIYIYIYTF